MSGPGIINLNIGPPPVPPAMAESRIQSTSVLKMLLSADAEKTAAEEPVKPVEKAEEGKKDSKGTPKKRRKTVAPKKPAKEKEEEKKKEKKKAKEKKADSKKTKKKSKNSSSSSSSSEEEEEEEEKTSSSSAPTSSSSSDDEEEEETSSVQAMKVKEDENPSKEATAEEEVWADEESDAAAPPPSEESKKEPEKKKKSKKKEKSKKEKQGKEKSKAKKDDHHHHHHHHHQEEESEESEEEEKDEPKKKKKKATKKSKEAEEKKEKKKKVAKESEPTAKKRKKAPSSVSTAAVEEAPAAKKPKKQTKKKQVAPKPSDLPVPATLEEARSAFGECVSSKLANTASVILTGVSSALSGDVGNLLGGISQLLKAWAANDREAIHGARVNLLTIRPPIEGERLGNLLDKILLRSCYKCGNSDLRTFKDIPSVLQQPELVLFCGTCVHEQVITEKVLRERLGLRKKPLTHLAALAKRQGEKSVTRYVLSLAREAFPDAVDCSEAPKVDQPPAAPVAPAPVPTAPSVLVPAKEVAIAPVPAIAPGSLPPPPAAVPSTAPLCVAAVRDPLPLSAARSSSASRPRVPSLSIKSKHPAKKKEVSPEVAARREEAFDTLCEGMLPEFAVGARKAYENTGKQGLNRINKLLDDHAKVLDANLSPDDERLRYVPTILAEIGKRVCMFDRLMLQLNITAADFGFFDNLKKVGPVRVPQMKELKNFVLKGQADGEEPYAALGAILAPLIDYLSEMKNNLVALGEISRLTEIAHVVPSQVLSVMCGGVAYKEFRDIFPELHTRPDAYKEIVDSIRDQVESAMGPDKFAELAATLNSEATEEQVKGSGDQPHPEDQFAGKQGLPKEGLLTEENMAPSEGGQEEEQEEEEEEKEERKEGGGEEDSEEERSYSSSSSSSSDEDDPVPPPKRPSSVVVPAAMPIQPQVGQSISYKLPSFPMTIPGTVAQICNRVTYEPPQEPPDSTVVPHAAEVKKTVS